MAALKCEDCDELLESYRAATVRLADGARRLTEASISREMDAFLRVWQEVHRLNLRCRELRKTMLRHLETHRVSA
jgi:hypothetical protein